MNFQCCYRWIPGSSQSFAESWSKTRGPTIAELSLATDDCIHRRQKIHSELLSAQTILGATVALMHQSYTNGWNSCTARSRLQGTPWPRRSPSRSPGCRAPRSEPSALRSRCPRPHRPRGHRSHGSILPRMEEDASLIQQTPD